MYTFLGQCMGFVVPEFFIEKKLSMMHYVQMLWELGIHEAYMNSPESLPRGESVRIVRIGKL